MKVLLLCLLLGTNPVWAQSERNHRIAMTLCDMNAENAARFAEFYTNRVNEIVLQTPPNSTERKQALAALQLELDSAKNSAYQENEKLRRHLESQGDLDSAQLSFVDSIHLMTMSNAQVFAIREPGKEKETYKRMILSDCREKLTRSLTK